MKYFILGIVFLGFSYFPHSASAKKELSRPHVKSVPQKVHRLLGLTIKLSSDEQLTMIPNGVSIQFGIGTRRMKNVSITKLQRAEKTMDPQISFSKGVFFQYHITPIQNEGSGGPEQTLEGILEVHQKFYRVLCYAQSDEWTIPDATFCISWLQALFI